MDRIEATDKIKETLDMYEKLNSENKNTAFVVIQGMLVSQMNTEKIYEKKNAESV